MKDKHLNPDQIKKNEEMIEDIYYILGCVEQTVKSIGNKKIYIDDLTMYHENMKAIILEKLMGE